MTWWLVCWQTMKWVSIHFTLACLITWKGTRLASPIAHLLSSTFYLRQALLCATWIQWKRTRNRRCFLQSMSPSSMKLRMRNSRMSVSVAICAKGIRVQRKTIMGRVCGRNTKPSWPNSGISPQKNPGIGNLAELPSGSTQLRHMKKPLVQALWTAKYPIKFLLCCYWFVCHPFLSQMMLPQFLCRLWWSIFGPGANQWLAAVDAQLV